MTVSRAQFLHGDWHGRSRVASLSDGSVLNIGHACLTWQGVLCRSCAEACEPAAIQFRPVAGSVPRPQLNASTCTACGDCVEVCPASAISLANTAATS